MRRQRAQLSWQWWVGTLLILLDFLSPVHSDGMTSYQLHMYEHLLFVLVIAPLLITGWQPRPLSRPLALIAFLLYVILIPLYHLTQLGDYFMQSPSSHLLELTAFTAVGMMFFWGPYLSNFERWVRVSYVGLALPVSIYTGLALMSVRRAPFWMSDSMNDSNHGIEMIHSGGVTMASISCLMLAVHIVVCLSLRGCHESP